MAAPRVNIELGLEAAEREGDGLGGYRLVWRQRGKLWAEMRAGSGRERFGQVGAESVVPWKVTVRGAALGDPRRPAAGQRFRRGDRLFRIEAVAESGPDGRWLICHAREEELA